MRLLYNSLAIPPFASKISMSHKNIISIFRMQLVTSIANSIEHLLPKSSMYNENRHRIVKMASLVRVSYHDFIIGSEHKELLEGHGRNVNFYPFLLQLNKGAITTL